MIKKNVYLSLFSLIFIFLLTSCTPKHENEKIEYIFENNEMYKETERFSLPQDSQIKDIVLLNDDIIVSDRENDTVLVYDKKGNLQMNIGKTGNGTDEFLSPTGLTVDEKDNLYILDSGNQRILKYDNNLNYVKTIKCEILKSSNPTSELLSLALFEETFYVTVRTLEKKLSGIYVIDKLGKTEKIEKDKVGYLNLEGNTVYFSNAFMFEKINGENSLSTGNSAIMTVNSDKNKVQYSLEDKLAPFKVNLYNEKYYMSCLGVAGVVEVDINNKISQLVYQLPYTDPNKVEIGQMDIDTNGDIYLIDSYNKEIVKLERVIE